MSSTSRTLRTLSRNATNTSSAAGKKLETLQQYKRNTFDSNRLFYADKNPPTWTFQAMGSQYTNHYMQTGRGIQFPKGSGPVSGAMSPALCWRASLCPRGLYSTKTAPPTKKVLGKFDLRTNYMTVLNVKKICSVTSRESKILIV